MSDRSGCPPVELTMLEVLDFMSAGRPRAHVRSAKALSMVDERVGLGPRYAYDLLLDLARPWILPVPTVAVVGNYGDRSLMPPASPEHTTARPSHAGRVVLDAEAGRLPPVPLGLINGSAYRGGVQPPLGPFAVVAALRRLLDAPRTSDDELVSIVGPPWSGTGCAVTADQIALARGRQAVVRESGRVTITGVPVPEESAERRPGDQQIYFYENGDDELPGAHLVIDALPGRTSAAEVAQAIADRASWRGWTGPHANLARKVALPIDQVDDRSQGADVRILLTLCPGADAAAVRDQLAAVPGMTAEARYAFPAPLASLLRSWVIDHQGEGIAASLTEFESAIRRDRRRALRQ